MKTQLQKPASGKSHCTPEFKEEALASWRVDGDRLDHHQRLREEARPAGLDAIAPNDREQVVVRAERPQCVLALQPAVLERRQQEWGLTDGGRQLGLREKRIRAEQKNIVSVEIESSRLKVPAQL